MISGLGSVPVFANTGFAGANRAGAGEPVNHSHSSGNEARAHSSGSQSPASNRSIAPVSESENTGKSSDQDLSKDEERAVQELKRRDDEVRAHERAHATAGGELAGSPSYDFTAGPDGKRYATGGEVQIDSAPVRGNPEATIRKMDVVIRAALAPANPSSQDLQVARQAQQARTQAQAELVEKSPAESSGEDESASLANPVNLNIEPSAAKQLDARNAYGAPEQSDEKEIADHIFDAAISISRIA